MLRGFEDDALEVLGLDVAVAIPVEEVEGLPDALPLQAAQHLRELRVGHVVAALAAADIERGPLAVPVEGDAVGALVAVVQLLEVVELDGARAVLVEQPERDLVLGVGLGQQVLEVAPVGDADLALPLPVGDAEEDGILLALDFVLCGES